MDPTLMASILAVLLFSTLGIIFGLTFFATRLQAILPYDRAPAPRLSRTTKTHTMIVLGSGGHTAEMLLGLRDMDTRRHNQRTWVVSSGDAFSIIKAVEFEKEMRRRVEARVGADAIQQKYRDRDVEDRISSEYGGYDVVVVPRARRIHQPLYTTPFSSLQCLWSCIQLLRKGPRSIVTTTPSSLTRQTSNSNSLNEASPPTVPNIILTNGPATAAILILASLLLRFFDLQGQTYNRPDRLRTVYFESWARVKKLSLSGRLLEHVVDRFVVQWEGLLEGSEEGEQAAEQKKVDGDDAKELRKAGGDWEVVKRRKRGRREYHGWLVIDPGVAGHLR